MLSKEQIYEAVWKYEKDTDIHAVTCVIYQIRKKIGKNYIKTHIGVGYQLDFGIGQSFFVFIHELDMFHTSIL